MQRAYKTDKVHYSLRCLSLSKDSQDDSDLNDARVFLTMLAQSIGSVTMSNTENWYIRCEKNRRFMLQSNGINYSADFRILRGEEFQRSRPVHYREKASKN